MKVSLFKASWAVCICIMPGVLVGEMTSQVNNGPPKQIKTKNYGHIIQELSPIYCQESCNLMVLE